LTNPLIMIEDSSDMQQLKHKVIGGSDNLRNMIHKIYEA